MPVDGWEGKNVNASGNLSDISSNIITSSNINSGNLSDKYHQTSSHFPQRKSLHRLHHITRYNNRRCCQYCGSPTLCSGQVVQFCIVLIFSILVQIWSSSNAISVFFPGTMAYPPSTTQVKNFVFSCVLCHLSLVISTCYMTSDE